MERIAARSQCRATLPVSEDDIRTALTLVPVRDHVAYALLTMLDESELGIYAAMHPQKPGDPDDPKVAALRETMFTTGEQTLKIYDRDPQVQRLLLIEYAKVPKQYPDADKLCALLLKHEPHSSEVYLLASQLRENEGKLNEALKYACTADMTEATNPEIRARIAHLHWLQHYQAYLKDPAPWKNPELKEMAAQYRYSLDGLGNLLDNNRYEYALVLFLLGRTPEAIEQGQALASNTDECNTLCQNFGYIGQVFHRDIEAANAIQQIRSAQTPTPPPAPAPVKSLDLFHK